MNNLQLATFAGGCFWCMVKPFDQYKGVKSVVSGFMGGAIENPTYQEVCLGNTGHREVIQIQYYEDEISYEEMLKIYWMQIDPTDTEGQFHDKGEAYKTTIFYHNNTQRELAEKSKIELEKSGRFNKTIVTEILPATKFYPAENEHQNYAYNNPTEYYRYFIGSGRMDFQKDNWDNKNLDNKAIKEKLTPIQYEVTQNSMTEKPFENEYWNKKEEGIYVDVITGEPLFSSKDKFISSCGWPAFTKPIKDTKVIKKADFSHNMYRTEVRSASSNGHLGHVFEDGPKEDGGLRYCINSAALRFISKDELDPEELKFFNRR